MSHKIIKDLNGFYRDDSNNAIVNNNKNEYQEYVLKRKNLLSEKERINTVEQKVDSLKKDIDDIKNILISIANINV